MPELPEVETVRRGLAPVLEGRRILQADVRRPDLRWPFPPGMAERLAGARVERLGRRSKYLLADLDSRETLIVHLGMSGRWLVSGVRVGVFHHALAAPEKHDHVILDVEGFPIQRYWYLVTCTGKRLPPVAQAFFDFLMGEDAATLMQPGNLL